LADILTVNQPAPEFALPADDGSVYSLAGVRASGPVLVFFYPGDFTPVCTAEVCAFRDDYEHYRSRGITILGISSDPVAKHQRFAAECRVPFRLLSDTNLEVARLYGARGLLGMRRAYYLIDRDGLLRWQHAEVLPIFKLSNTRILEAIDQVFGSPADHSSHAQGA
jgi:peroxiredoxin Q/BCP